MNTTPVLRSIAFLFAAGSLLASCSGEKAKNEPMVQQAVNAPPDLREDTGPVPMNVENLKINVYEVKDSASGKSLGWGYDIVFAGGGKVHQPTIPAVQGIQYFSSQEKAKTTAEFAAAKIRRYGGLTGITMPELDSLGVIK